MLANYTLNVEEVTLADHLTSPTAVGNRHGTARIGPAGRQRMARWLPRPQSRVARLLRVWRESRDAGDDQGIDEFLPFCRSADINNSGAYFN